MEATPDGNLKAKKFIFTTPKTSYYAIDESQFVGTQGGTILRGRNNAPGGAFFYGNPTGIGTGMFAPVNLPHGAKITKVIAHFDDISVNFNLSIKISTHAFDTGAYTDITTITTSGSGGYGSIENGSLNHIVDNKIQSYQAMVSVVDLSNVNAFWQGYFTVIRGISIEYTIQEAN